MSEAIRIKGNVAAAVNAEDGSVIHIHVNTEDTQESRQVQELLKTCDEVGFRRSLERISYKMHGTAMFRDLNADQLMMLQEIADVFVVHSKEKVDIHNVFRDEIEHYNEFSQKAGIRASALERNAITRLVTDYPVSYRQAQICWNNGNLFYHF